jgi:hypothetical protein
VADVADDDDNVAAVADHIGYRVVDDGDNGALVEDRRGMHDDNNVVVEVPERRDNNVVVEVPERRDNNVVVEDRCGSDDDEKIAAVPGTVDDMHHNS